MSKGYVLIEYGGYDESEWTHILAISLDKEKLENMKTKIENEHDNPPIPMEEYQELLDQAIYKFYDEDLDSSEIIYKLESNHYSMETLRKQEKYSERFFDWDGVEIQEVDYIE